LPTDLQALQSGALAQEEWQSYLELQKEVAHERRKTDKAEMANSKKRWKEITKFARAHKKNRGS
jgi:ribosome biogenesis GTPase